MKKIFLILIVVAVALWIVFSLMAPKAPLADGLRLTYDYGGTTVSVTFTEVSRNTFKVTVSPGNSEEIVNRKFKTRRSTVYQADPLGPLWIPPSSVKVGGNAHGDKVAEVKRWKTWDVGIVKASFGVGGAVRGEWYYDKTTGFLVGGNIWTALSAQGEGIQFALIEGNLEELNN